MERQRSEIRVIRLTETHPEEATRAADTMAVLRIWSLLGGAGQLRDRAIGNRLL